MMPWYTFGVRTEAMLENRQSRDRSSAVAAVRPSRCARIVIRRAVRALNPDDPRPAAILDLALAGLTFVAGTHGVPPLLGSTALFSEEALRQTGRGLVFKVQTLFLNR